MINKIFIGFTAVTYGYLGGWALFDPSSYVTAVGLTINTDLGSAEIRAVYLSLIHISEPTRPY